MAASVNDQETVRAAVKRAARDLLPHADLGGAPAGPCLDAICLEIRNLRKDLQAAADRRRELEELLQFSACLIRSLRASAVYLEQTVATINTAESLFEKIAKLAPGNPPLFQKAAT